MNIHALAWAMKADSPSAPAKLALAVLASLADDDARTTATIAEVMQGTMLSESTVRDSLGLLIHAGLIRTDAGTMSSKRVITLLMSAHQ